MEEIKDINGMKKYNEKRKKKALSLPRTIKNNKTFKSHRKYHRYVMIIYIVFFPSSILSSYGVNQSVDRSVNLSPSPSL